MSQLISFFIAGHDLPMVALAATICLISAFAGINLMRHAKRSTGRMRITWNIISAFAVGFGIWTTHFVAMLAFRPGFSPSYDVRLTLLSLFIAIVVCGAGLALAIRSEAVHDKFLGGATVGVGISTMHYVGMGAMMLQGQPSWDSGLVGLSILAGIALGGVAVVVGDRQGWRAGLAGTGILTLAICAMHFTAMGAVDFSNCLPLNGTGDIDSGLLSWIAAGLALLIFAAAFGSLLLDEADRRRTAREREREAADAARLAEVSNRLRLALGHMGQGLALFGADGRVALHNERLNELLSLPPGSNLVGRSMSELLDDAAVRLQPVTAGRPVTGAELLAKHMSFVRDGGGEMTQTFADDRSFRVCHSPTGDGSWVTTIEDISESRRNAAAIAHMAQHDPLTGLPNRAHFNELFETAIGQAQRAGAKLAVVAFDLDRFKEINDNYGHAAGDHVLHTLAVRLKSVMQPGESVARLGGDEFAAIKSFAGMDSLRDFLNRIESALFGRVEIDDFQVSTAGSIGVAIFPQDGHEPSKLMNNADLAMYRAKAEFDLRVCYYEFSMDEQAREQRALAQDIWRAIDQEQFHLAYQVQKSVATEAITGFEVLLRWNRPGHGPVSPAIFVPVAEECGAITAIGNWVLKTACLEAASWPQPHKIAVNVSGLQLGQPELVDMVKMVLEQSGLAPNRLELEVTETAIISDKKRALHILSQIRALGVSVAIDDFGTGYSSLETLRSFPFDKIKLDRSFMREVESDDQAKAIVRAILALGKSLAVPVLAEGVETTEQLHVLRAEGCNEAQGFLLGRPGRMDWGQGKTALA